jgi:hypothetical protein
MPAAASKANYKSYEAQARMVRAIVAAHPEVKWNYKGKRLSCHAYVVLHMACDMYWVHFIALSTTSKIDSSVSQKLRKASALI